MTRFTRRGVLAASTAALTLGPLAGAATAGETHGALVHHVLFWLKRPDSLEDRDALVAGIRSLGRIDTVRAVHVGFPADTMARGVVDGSWSVSEMLWFDDAAGQDAYQVHPLHQEFVAAHEHLWERVVVYDVMAAP